MSRNVATSRRRPTFVFLRGILLLAVIAVSGAGCNKSAPEPAAAGTAAAPPAAGSTDPAAAPPVAAAAPRSEATQWIGGIPYDVFYDRPLDVAADQTLLASTAATPGGNSPVAATPSTPAMTPEANTAPAPDSGAGATPSGQPNWEEIAPMELLLAEVTTLRNGLQTKLNTLADYNRNWETVGTDATALAAIAGVIEQHPGDVSWKANANIARHLSAEINSSASKTGRSAFEGAKTPYDSLIDLLSGNPPGGVEAEANLPFADYADRSTLMATIEANLNSAKANITTQERLAENADEVKRRMTVLATLMSVVSTPSYDSTDEADYQTFSRTFVTAAMDARQAVDTKDIESFTAAIGTMQRTCSECHAKYAL